MAKRDPAKTARNKRVDDITAELRSLQDDVLEITDCELLPFHAKIGSKYQEFANVKFQCILSADELLSRYLDGLARELRSKPPHIRQQSALYTLAKWYREEPKVCKYIDLFIERTFLKKYDELARVKPEEMDAELWIGGKNADYGILVTPRFNEETDEWENDKSEIRKFKPDYFTIGHVLETGLVIPGKEKRINFSDVDAYLTFFQDTIVRASGSKHQDAIAERYVEFVEQADEPLKVPLLIPELRYRGREKKHKYRLDYCVIDPFSLQKVGFELSPWSSHGWLTGTDKKLVKDVNAEAAENYARDVEKLRDYFFERNIFVVVYTDEQLADPDGIFKSIKKYLKPAMIGTQMLIHSRAKFMEMDLDAEVDEEVDGEDGV